VGKTILVVDDEKHITIILNKYLSREGFEVLTATDGESALKIAKEYEIDLIILDIMMPGMDGGDVMANLMKDGQLKNIPIVFLTGLIADNETAAFNGNSAGRLILSKSLDIKEQVKAIKEVLDD